MSGKLIAGLFAGAIIGISAFLGLKSISKHEQKSKKKADKGVINNNNDKINVNKESEHKSATNNLNNNDNDTTDDNFVETLKCPISFKIMKDPVITPNGITYDRESITDWLNKSKICPITKNPLNKNDLIQNRHLKIVIDKYISNHNTI